MKLEKCVHVSVIVGVSTYEVFVTVDHFEISVASSPSHNRSSPGCVRAKQPTSTATEVFILIGTCPTSYICHDI